MKHAGLTKSGTLAAILGMLLISNHALSQPVQGAMMQLVQSDNCYAIGQRVAADKGGTLAAATAENRGGQIVCKIVVVIPGANGQRPKRTEVIVPAG